MTETSAPEPTDTPQSEPTGSGEELATETPEESPVASEAPTEPPSEAPADELVEDHAERPGRRPWGPLRELVVVALVGLLVCGLIVMSSSTSPASCNADTLTRPAAQPEGELLMGLSADVGGHQVLVGYAYGETSGSTGPVSFTEMSRSVGVVEPVEMTKHISDHGLNLVQPQGQWARGSEWFIDASSGAASVARPGLAALTDLRSADIPSGAWYDIITEARPTGMKTAPGLDTPLESFTSPIWISEASTIASVLAPPFRSNLDAVATKAREAGLDPGEIPAQLVLYCKSGKLMAAQIKVQPRQAGLDMADFSLFAALTSERDVSLEMPSDSSY